MRCTHFKEPLALLSSPVVSYVHAASIVRSKPALRRSKQHSNCCTSLIHLTTAAALASTSLAALQNSALPWYAVMVPPG